MPATKKDVDKTYKIELTLDDAAFKKIRSATNSLNLLGEDGSWKGDVAHEFANRLIVAIQDGEDNGEDIVRLRVRLRG